MLTFLSALLSGYFDSEKAKLANEAKEPKFDKRSLELNISKFNEEFEKSKNEAKTQISDLKLQIEFRKELNDQLDTLARNSLESQIGLLNQLEVVFSAMNNPSLKNVKFGDSGITDLTNELENKARGLKLYIQNRLKELPIK